jgi:mono/diheme cytochrome c family protein
MKKSRPKPPQSSASAPEGLPETPAPAVGRYSAPAGFFLAVGLLLYLGQAEGCYNHGLFSAGVFEPYADLRSIPRAGGEVDRVEAGREVYAAAGCVACHQPNGTGNPANGCPPLAKSDWVLEEDAGRLIRIVLHGSQGPMEVNGETWNGVMTPFGPNLTDEQIANVLSFIRGSPEWGNSASEVTPERVREVREKTASRTRSWTAPELLQIPVTE